jgi:Na+-translocating ferredoxin:NAD+ oxidoreductase subunit G
MSASWESSATGMAARTAIILFLFIVVFTGLLSTAQYLTRPAIEASATEEKMKLLDEVLPRQEYDNRLLDDTLTLPPTAALGLAGESTLYRARRGGEPVAVIFEAVAPDAYAGRLRLLIAVRSNGEIAGVRVTQHKETPGLGDYIEPRKDKNKAAPWISQFQRLSLAQVQDKEWKVRKDGGRFDYYAGATVTPRAVVKAVHKALQWADAQGDALFAVQGVKP